MKKCVKCGCEKPLTDFYKQKTSLDGHGSYCKICNKAEVKKYAANNPEKTRDSWTRGRLRYKGVLLDDAMWQKILDLREAGCSICGKTDDLVIDHCHDKSHVRGVLCRTCNIGLGMFHDNPDNLESAIRYLASPPFGEG